MTNRAPLVELIDGLPSIEGGEYVALTPLCVRLKLNAVNQYRKINKVIPTSLRILDDVPYISVTIIPSWLMDIDIKRLELETKTTVLHWRNKLVLSLNQSTPPPSIPLAVMTERDVSPDTLATHILKTLQKVSTIDVDGLQIQIEMYKKQMQAYAQRIDAALKKHTTHAAVIELVNTNITECKTTVAQIKTALQSSDENIRDIYTLIEGLSDTNQRYQISINNINTQFNDILSALTNVPRRAHSLTAVTITREHINAFVTSLDTQGLIPKFGNHGNGRPRNRIHLFYNLMFNAVIPDYGRLFEGEPERILPNLTRDQFMSCYNWLYDYSQRVVFELVKQQNTAPVSTQPTGPA